MLRLFIVGVGGAAGAISRYLLEGFVHSSINSNFPLGTLTVNITGCFALGFLATLADEKFLFNPSVRMGIFVGFIGAFTTFSTFTYETWALLKDSQQLMAALNVLLSLAGGFVGLLLGIIFARII